MKIIHIQYASSTSTTLFYIYLIVIFKWLDHDFTFEMRPNKKKKFFFSKTKKQKKKKATVRIIYYVGAANKNCASKCQNFILSIVKEE